MTLTEFLEARIAEDEAAAKAASSGPWYYNGYGNVSSAPIGAAYEAFWTEDREKDGHTYEHQVGQICPACGERPACYGDTAKPEVRGQRFGTYWDCALWDEAYDADGNVALIPAHHGDTAIGRHRADAEHIARHDPARVLADCNAKRIIVAEHSDTSEGFDDACYTCVADIRVAYGEPSVTFKGPNCPTLRALALPYADHPDYRDEWRQ